jgi:tripartite-type tricarboxylate transporter receptor subunit TctC
MKRCAVSLAALALFAANVAHAQEPWPTKPVKFIIAFAPAGVADPIGRFIGQALSEKWGQPVVIENRGGAGGNLGAQLVARAEPDGYTVLVTTSAFTVNLSLYEKPGYSFEDFQTGAVASSSPNMIVAAPNLKYNTLPEIIAAAKTENLSFGSAGVGTTPHLTGELIFRLLGKVDIRHVPFTGAGPAVAALMGGHVPLVSAGLPGVIEHVKAGTIKGIALATPGRRDDMPGVPTIEETGIGKVEASTAVPFFFPAKTPRHIVEKFNADLNAILASGALNRQFASAGASPVTKDLKAAHEHVAAEIQQWGGVVRSLNLKPE